MLQRESSPTESQSWQVSIAGRLCGPVDEAGLRRMAAIGQLSRFSIVQQVGTPEWRPIAAVPELTEILPDLPVNTSFFFRVFRPDPTELISTLVVFLLVGCFWAGQAGWFSKHNHGFTPAPANPIDVSKLVAQATAALRESRWADADAYFDLALGVGLEETPTSVTQIAWAALAPRLTDLPALGRKGFDYLYGRCVMDDLPESVTEHPAWLFAQAIDCQEHENWNQMKSLLQDVASSTVDPALAGAAKKILAPPEPGRREYERPPIIFRTPAKRLAIRIALLAAEVTTEALVMELRVSNTAVRRQRLAYPVGQTGNNLLCLIDDHGQAVPAPLGFGDAGQLLPDRGLRVMELARWGSVKLTARFPMIDPGATRVRFVSPRLQDQIEWGWEDIPLKAGSFDKPLRVLPLKIVGLSSAKPTSSVEIKTASSATTTPRNLSQQPISAAQTSLARTTVTLSSSDQDLKRKKKMDEQKAKKAAQERAERKAEIEREKEAQLRAERDARLRDEEARQKLPLQHQAYQAYQQAKDAREKSSRNFSINPNKRSLFMKADAQMKKAGDAYNAGDYGKATEYYQIATDGFQKSNQVKVDDGINTIKNIIRFRR